MNLPRILLAAPKSGSGKTTIVCGLLKALQQRGLTPAACKCGPDYIDPMFHREVIGIQSANLDLFFTPEQTARALLLESAKDCDVAVLEGVMGYYDGLGGTSDTASAYHVSRATATPTILVLDAKGASLSLCAAAKGFRDFRPDSGICGVILNRCSAMQYAMLAPVLQAQSGLTPLGYVPNLPECQLESRHLGLVTAQEVGNLQQLLTTLADTLTQTLDLDGILALAQTAPDLDAQLPLIAPVDGSPTIAVAMDKAFCFYYQENLTLLRRLGAKLVYFSPLQDATLPPCDGLYLGGGYPELYAQQLAANESMLASMADAIEGGLPTFAECGGFLYLHETLVDDEGQAHRLVGAISGSCHNTKKLSRFGYVELTARCDNLLCGEGDTIRAHEFHYYDSTANGSDFVARKPSGTRKWDCIHGGNTLFAGFPHLYFHANVDFARRFVTACANAKTPTRKDD